MEPKQKFINRKLLLASVLLIGIFIIVVSIFLSNRASRGGTENPALELYKSSLKALEKEVNQSPDDYNVNKDYAYALYVTSNDSKAIKAYSKVVEMNPKDAVSYNNLGNIYRKDQRYDDAINAYEKSIEIQSSQINAYINLAHLYIYDLKNYDKGYKVFLMVINKNPQNINLRIMLAKTYEQQKDTDAAIKLYQSILKIDPNNQEAKNSLEKLNNG